MYNEGRGKKGSFQVTNKWNFQHIPHVIYLYEEVSIAHTDLLYTHTALHNMLLNATIAMMIYYLMRNVKMKEMPTEIRPPFAKPCSYAFCTMGRMRTV